MKVPMLKLGEVPMFAEADGPSKLKPEKSLRFSNFWDKSPKG